MDLELTGKAAAITGSSRGIGKHIAIALAREGCDLAISGRDASVLGVAAQELRDLGVKVADVAGDLLEPAAAERFVTAAHQAFGRLDVLVNCVGGGRGGTFNDSTDEDWQGALNLNVMPAIRASRAAIPFMRDQGGGSIIII